MRVPHPATGKLKKLPEPAAAVERSSASPARRSSWGNSCSPVALHAACKPNAFFVTTLQCSKTARENLRVHGATGLFFWNAIGDDIAGRSSAPPQLWTLEFTAKDPEGTLIWAWISLLRD